MSPPFSIPPYLFSGLPHFIHLSPIGGCSSLHLGHTTTSRALQNSQESSKKVVLPHLGQVTSRDSPQLLHFFQPFSTGFRHFGHLMGPTGFALPHTGQTFESAEINALQKRHGCLYPGMPQPPLCFLVCSNIYNYTINPRHLAS
jgi:hypothetical protein